MLYMLYTRRAMFHGYQDVVFSGDTFTSDLLKLDATFPGINPELANLC